MTKGTIFKVNETIIIEGETGQSVRRICKLYHKLYVNSRRKTSSTMFVLSFLARVDFLRSRAIFFQCIFVINIKRFKIEKIEKIQEQKLVYIISRNAFYLLIIPCRRHTIDTCACTIYQVGYRQNISIEINYKTYIVYVYSYKIYICSALIIVYLLFDREKNMRLLIETKVRRNMCVYRF